MGNFEKPPVELPQFLVYSSSGDFHGIFNDHDVAFRYALAIEGYIAEVTYVSKAVTLEQVIPDDETRRQVEYFLENPGSGVRRERPVRKTDIDDDESSVPLDPPSTP